MRTFLQILFVVWSIAALVKMTRLAVCDYPRTNKVSVGEDCAGLVELVTFALVAAFLLWGR